MDKLVLLLAFKCTSLLLRSKLVQRTLRIWSYSGAYFPSLGLNTKRYGVSPCDQSECLKILNRINPTMDTFLKVEISGTFSIFLMQLLRVKQFLLRKNETAKKECIFPNAYLVLNKSFWRLCFIVMYKAQNKLKFRL